MTTVEPSCDLGPDLGARLERDPQAAVHARRMVRTFLGGLPHTVPRETAEAVTLVVSELVTNVVRHARGRLCSLDLRDMGHGVGISVSDDDPEPPRPKHLDLTGQGGFGWPLVRRLSAELTVLSRPDGKTVHAVVRF
ncbi:ATP-binding protein [Streptomyces sp. NBC_00151]|uniref:ATP-binding protein n=1 Tax=Streptomyces sp. NBC_00151 TaxID=2975669 RepID=UPI002DDAD0A5|nr:ATP-binding protein [Streptomyces sp. NBC_00151]WRZ43830.1 ATP-binding protein [Streptomyces sp. NBC_00151]